MTVSDNGLGIGRPSSTCVLSAIAPGTIWQRLQFRSRLQRKSSRVFELEHVTFWVVAVAGFVT
jgi:hypothetical protein